MEVDLESAEDEEDEGDIEYDGVVDDDDDDTVKDAESLSDDDD